MNDYLKTAEEVYAEAARQPNDELCCAHPPVWRLPDLRIPPIMLQMNYSCGSTVDARDLKPEDTILYVGVGGGLEALQFAYFARRPGGVIAIDPVAEMRERARENFLEAACLNSWFHPEFVTLLDGSALDLPIADNSVTVVAQNCLYNIFVSEDFGRALSEVVRVLKPGGLFSSSDPITPAPLPPAFTANARLRAKCISGCQTLEAYLEALTDAGFGRVEFRARVPYRYLLPSEYSELSSPIMLESIEVAAYKVPFGLDGPMVFTGRTATYTGPEAIFSDGIGHTLQRGVPVSVSEAAAKRLSRAPEIVLTSPTWHVRGGGCC
jgi:ubiquinone/menaquinone biosynthesis C-methylase UbiE